MFNFFKEEVREIVMDNITFERLQEMQYDAGFANGWFKGALIATGIMGYLWYRDHMNKQIEEVEVEAEEVKTEEEEKED